MDSVSICSSCLSISVVNGSMYSDTFACQPAIYQPSGLSRSLSWVANFYHSTVFAEFSTIVFHSCHFDSYHWSLPFYMTSVASLFSMDHRVQGTQNLLDSFSRMLINCCENLMLCGCNPSWTFWYSCRGRVIKGNSCYAECVCLNTLMFEYILLFMNHFRQTWYDDRYCWANDTSMND